RQFSKRKIEIDAFEIVLACAADFDAAALSRRDDTAFFPVPRTHWRQSFHAMRSANSVESPPVHARVIPSASEGPHLSSWSTQCRLCTHCPVAGSLSPSRTGVVCTFRDDRMRAEGRASGLESRG